MANYRQHKPYILDQSEPAKMLYQRTWLVPETLTFRELEIMDTAVLIAPEGKQLTLIENGIVRETSPGKYAGEVVLRVSDSYEILPLMGMMANIENTIWASPAICVEKNKFVPEKSVTEAVQGGVYDGDRTEGIYIASEAESFNGIVIDGSKYEIKDVQMDLEGFGINDFVGAGSGVAIYGDSDAVVRDSQFHMMGVTRCVIHSGGDSNVLVKNCDIFNFSSKTDSPPDWLNTFCWNLPLIGGNRLVELSDNSTTTFDNCNMKTNGWGICSIDNFFDVKLIVKNSSLQASGPQSHAYGIFCIGPTEVEIDNTVMDVTGYPLFMMGWFGKARAKVTGGSVLKGRRFGIFSSSDDNSIVTVSDSTIDTALACIVVRSSCSTYNISRSVLKPGDGALIRVIDNVEEYMMNQISSPVPVGVSDEPIEGRDLTVASERDDLTFNFDDMEIKGDIYNSTTNIRAERGGVFLKDSMGRFHDTMLGPESTEGLNEHGTFAEMIHSAYEWHGPKNVGINLTKTKITGVISSALQAYRDGVTEIDPDNRREGANVMQWAAPTVNNGVVVTLDAQSAWNVTGTSYITSLSIEDGATVTGADGKNLVMTVDGVEKAISPGTYKGAIALSLS